MLPSGVRPYLVDWFNNRFLSVYNDLGGKPDKIYNDDIGKYVTVSKEKRAGLTTKQIADRIGEKFGGLKLSTKECYEKYLIPLINLGIIDHIESEIRRNQHIYFPVQEDTHLFHVFDEKAGLKLKIPSLERFPSKNFLKSQFGILSKSSFLGGDIFEKNISSYKLVDVDGSEITIDQLIEKYFTNPEECFVKTYKEDEDNTSNKQDNNGNGNGSTLETLLKLKAAATSNILYQSQILMKQKNNFFSHPSVTMTFTRFSNNNIEECKQRKSKNNKIL